MELGIITSERVVIFFIRICTKHVEKFLKVDLQNQYDLTARCIKCITIQVHKVFQKLLGNVLRQFP